MGSPPSLRGHCRTRRAWLGHRNGVLTAPSQPTFASPPPPPPPCLPFLPSCLDIKRRWKRWRWLAIVPRSTVPAQQLRTVLPDGTSPCRLIRTVPRIDLDKTRQQLTTLSTVPIPNSKDGRMVNIFISLSCFLLCLTLRTARSPPGWILQLAQQNPCNPVRLSSRTGFLWPLDRLAVYRARVSGADIASPPFPLTATCNGRLSASLTA